MWICQPTQKSRSCDTLKSGCSSPSLPSSSSFSETTTCIFKTVFSHDFIFRIKDYWVIPNFFIQYYTSKILLTLSHVNVVHTFFFLLILYKFYMSPFSPIDLIHTFSLLFITILCEYAIWFSFILLIDFWIFPSFCFYKHVQNFIWGICLQTACL